MSLDRDRLRQRNWRRETGKAHTAAFRIAVCIDRSNSLPPFHLHIQSETLFGSLFLIFFENYIMVFLGEYERNEKLPITNADDRE